MSTHVFHRMAARCFIAAILIAAAPVEAQHSNPVDTLKSTGGVPIAIECTGTGPTLLLVHGGTGDRSRWTPLFPFFSSRFTVCAMDRRGHGASGDSSDYNLQKEAEDVAAVVEARQGPVFVVGHSYGAVAALEASFLTRKIAKLVLYEPPVQERDLTALANKVEEMVTRESASRRSSSFC